MISDLASLLFNLSSPAVGKVWELGGIRERTSTEGKVTFCSHRICLQRHIPCSCGQCKTRPLKAVPKLASENNIRASDSPERHLRAVTGEKDKNIHSSAFKGVSGCRRQVLQGVKGGIGGHHKKFIKVYCYADVMSGRWPRGLSPAEATRSLILFFNVSLPSL